MLKIIHRPAYPSTTDRHHVSYCSKVSKFCQEGFFKHALKQITPLVNQDISPCVFLPAKIYMRILCIFLWKHIAD
jgi:hypothetical protein